VRAWLAKNISDSETANWVLTNTKNCPKCRRPIEKNQGCNHMTCSTPCYHQFCWICLGPCECGSYRARQNKVNAGQRRREQAKASLDRHLYHYERWAANHTSLQMVFKDMADLERSGLEKMAVKVHVPASDLRFLTQAYEQVADCRRVLRWAHAYGYFLDPERDATKRNLFDHLQKDANSSLERLHGCAEVERMELCAGDTADVTERYKSYKKKLQGLTQVTRHYFENLVKAFETNLAEVETAE
jgi:ariadne-1